MMENKCGLEVIKKDGTVECRAICLPHCPKLYCCRYCNEIKVCKKVCGFVRKQKGIIIK